MRGRVGASLPAHFRKCNDTGVKTVILGVLARLRPVRAAVCFSVVVARRRCIHGITPVHSQWARDYLEHGKRSYYVESVIMDGGGEDAPRVTGFSSHCSFPLVYVNLAA